MIHERGILKNKMKSLMRIILVLSFLALLTGCGNAEEASEKDDSEEVEEIGKEITLRYPWEEDSSWEEDGLSKEPNEDEKKELEIREIMEGMTLEEKVCQLFMVTPEQITGVDVAVMAGDTTREALQKYPVGGIVYFSQNIIDEQQIKTMVENTKSYSKYPLFVGVDEEGGSQVARIALNENFTVEKVPDMQVIGASGDYEQAYSAGQIIGSYLYELGFNLDFAPVADVLTNPENTAIGPRSFGADASVDAGMVSRFTEGMQEKQVSAVLKHFPGHGGTIGDSHEEAVTNEGTLEQLKSTEFVPFKSGIQAGADCVMAGHISLPSVTGDTVPASLSQKIVTGLLREELGFKGVVITDSMQMGAVTNYYTPAEAAVKAVQAGVDVILMPQDFVQAYEGLLSAVRNGEISDRRIDESVYRILECKRRE